GRRRARARRRGDRRSAPRRGRGRAQAVAGAARRGGAARSAGHGGHLPRRGRRGARRRPTARGQRVQARACPPHARRCTATADRGSQPVSTGESRPAVAMVPEGWTPTASPDPLVRVKHGLIGAQVSRLDGPLKVRGEARFAAEYVMEGMVYAALRYSTIARGRITSLDTGAAEAAAGVVLVMTRRNAPLMAPPPL